MIQTVETLQQELAQTTEQIDIFFRADDIDEDEPLLHRMLEAFALRRVPLNLEIIPGRLTGAAIGLLQQARRADPALLELNQHGWMHDNHEREGRKCEFGPGRAFAEQRADIARGREAMDEAFGPDWHAVFTPPWNRCTTDTFRALDELGFAVLSGDAGREPLTGYGFLEIPATLDLYRWKGGARLKAPQEVIGELVGQIQERRVIGLLLHHKVMDDAAFSLLDLLLDTLGRHAQVRLHTFRTLRERLTAAGRQRA